jgi:hypothetical protein
MVLALFQCHLNPLFSLSKIWDIGKTTFVLGQKTCKVIPVIHAISGCDTTSKLYGVGKRAALKKFMDSQTLKELGDVFLKISQMEDIIKSGERIITNLYGKRQDSYPMQ